MDPSVLAHELAHAVHLGRLGTPQGFTPDNTAKVSPREYVEWLGVLEGTANLFAALQGDDPAVARGWLADAGYDVDRRADYGRLPTYRDRFRRQVESTEFARLYPKTVAERRNELREGGDSLDLPDPYLASVVFTQPLWRASRQYGRRAVERLLLRALGPTGNVVGYRRFAAALREAADGELREFLDGEFRKRGL